MTDEEKKAINRCKQILLEEKKSTIDNYKFLSELYGNDDIEMLLNIIEKQSKEIEENKKYLVNLTHEQYIKLVEQIRSEINKEWKDVIKAKIEDILNSENGEAIEKLIEWQSLLEKE